MSTPRLLVTAQVQLSSHTRATYLPQRNSQQQSETSHSLPHHYRTIPQCCTIYSVAIAQFHNITQSTRPLSLYTAILTSYHNYYALWHYYYSTKVHCALLLHQVTRNPSRCRHITTGHIDRLIRKGHTHFGHCFRRTWPKLASHIRICCRMSM
jgi:hypothetical protein